MGAIMKTTRVLRQRQADTAGGFASPVSDTATRLNLAVGIANIVKCAGINSSDRVVIVTDRETLRVGNALKSAAEGTGAHVEFILMEDLGERPLTSLPLEIAKRIRASNPTISFFAAAMKEGELGFRAPLITMLTGEFNVRHVHMPGVTDAVVGGEAMCADYGEVRRITASVLNIVNNAQVISVSAPNGTDLRIFLDHRHEELGWYPDDGEVKQPGKFANLPGGEVFTSPLSVNGTFVTMLLGDYFAKKYGVMEHPVKITIRDSRMVSVSCEDKQIEAEVYSYLKKGTNTDRVGEFAIGTNIGVTRFIGNMLADEKAAGIHIAFGDPLGDETGAKWTVDPMQHCDMVVQGCTISVDGRKIMDNGHFTI